MKTLGWAAVILATFWLQASFLGALRPLDVIPNLLLVILIVAAPICAASQTVTLGVASGVLLDLASGADFGLRTAFYSLLAVTLVFLKRSGADMERWSMAITALAAGTFLYNAAVIGTLIASRVPIPWLVVLQRCLAELVMNVVIFVVTKWLLSHVFVRLTSQERA
jgi:rod shape-determining protein MreD